MILVTVFRPTQTRIPSPTKPMDCSGSTGALLPDKPCECIDGQGVQASVPGSPEHGKQDHEGNRRDGCNLRNGQGNQTRRRILMPRDVPQKTGKNSFEDEEHCQDSCREPESLAPQCDPMKFRFPFRSGPKVIVCCHLDLFALRHWVRRRWLHVILNVGKVGHQPRPLMRRA